MKSSYDVVILGAGHNGLVAATYLARAGLSVLLLEKNDYIGGATTSQQVFPDFDARLSRYSYLVSLFPEKIIRDLDLKIELIRRKTGSFTPYLRNGRHEGLLLSNVDEEASRCSLLRLTGNDIEHQELKRFYSLARIFAEQVWDTMLEPLVSREKFHRRFQIDSSEQEAWRSLVEEPLGCAIERYLQDDVLRGVVLTDGKIGVFTHPHDPSLLQNRCFLYHLIGNKTGEWRVPRGGMGQVAGELERAARQAGAEMQTQVELSAIEAGNKVRTVHFNHKGKALAVDARFLLVNFGRNVLSRYLAHQWLPNATDEGSVFKINMLLRRLPKLKTADHPATDAFCGTFHCDEGYEEMKRSYEQAGRGELPERPPCEVYCHTLTDDSILSPDLRARGFQTMTLFGIDTPWSLFARDNETMRARVERAFLDGMNRWLAEPLEDCLAVARDGRPCIESRSPVDIEESLGMYHGNIFQSALTFPFAESDAEVGKLGVETEFENVFLCGSSAQRGGAVSGIPGHNAARKVLESIAGKK
jgi:phytoene dehydrogenase-like protein